MKSHTGYQSSPWKQLTGANLGYVQDLYEQYIADPEQVPEDMRLLFDEQGGPPADGSAASPDAMSQRSSGAAKQADSNVVTAAVKLVWNIRAYGHLAADIKPLKEPIPKHTRYIEPEYYGLTAADLEGLPARAIWEDAPENISTAREAIDCLKSIYTNSIAYEFAHVFDVEERLWLNQTVESGAMHRSLSNDERKELLHDLMQVEGFEQYLHRTFVGQKRFSIEGVDMLVPMLDELIQAGIHDRAEHIFIGMAHRGRLNVLAHILGKSYGMIFSEFHHAPNKDMIPSEGSMGINYGWTGDVKYHLGADRSLKEGQSGRARITLANNPSHLEFVNPVVEGMTRAAQEDRSKPGFPAQDVMRSFSILVHGDASFAGEGIVSETLNLSRLPGYHTGGTVHIIANNRIGFTTESMDSRSTLYASDLAKGFEIPIIHVNADDPEACLDAIRFAYEYRCRFKKDFLIDLIGFRRYGHNEMDDPMATQPQLYSKVKNHPDIAEGYKERLIENGTISREEADQLQQELLEQMQQEYEPIKSGSKKLNKVKIPTEQEANAVLNVDTAVPRQALKEINEALLEWPEKFHVYPKLERILKRRSTAFEEGGNVDWALAETLAFATILADGKPIRMTGQDSERGTFAQRHLILHDIENGSTFSPLHVIPQAKASFALYNSPLSEASVLGFEYGYNIHDSDTLVVWEAQYGDFANAAQVIIDQFMAAGRAKWDQRSSLVLLLPHGYEGQGPEHSSARLERYLELAAENNWSVANVTTAAQYFHILRRQAGITGKVETRPLVMMTPKSMLRNPRTASSGEHFSEGRFQRVLQAGLTTEDGDPHQVERIILCSGKIAVDLEETLDKEKGGEERRRIIRVEQLYPFPRTDIESIMEYYPYANELIWLQEEPKNMGAWRYIEPKLREVARKGMVVNYIGRPEHSSPASGHPDVHQKEQTRIITEALELKVTQSQ